MDPFELFRAGRISSARAAAELRVSRALFLEQAAARGIPIANQDEADIEAEIERIRASGAVVQAGIRSAMEGTLALAAARGIPDAHILPGTWAIVWSQTGPLWGRMAETSWLGQPVVVVEGLDGQTTYVMVSQVWRIDLRTEDEVRADAARWAKVLALDLSKGTGGGDR